MAAQIAQTLIPQSNGREDKPEPFIYRSLDKFFTLTLDMFFIVSFEGYFQQLNPRCEKTLGYTTEELLSQRWIEAIHPEDQPLMSEYFQRLTTETGTVQFESRYCCKDGSYKWLVWNATSCPEQELIYAVARDNTECRQAEAAQRESEECFRLLVEGVKDYAIIMLDPLGRIVSWNAGAERIHQYRACEIIGQPVSCFYPSEDIQRGIPEQGLYIAALQGRFEDEGWRVCKDGSKFWA
ncbi:MAG: PAS domain-containing protein, partial [Cyanobacteriota bacterium]